VWLILDIQTVTVVNVSVTMLFHNNWQLEFSHCTFPRDTGAASCAQFSMNEKQGKNIFASSHSLPHMSKHHSCCSEL
jgi:hypothetical protein